MLSFIQLFTALSLASSILGAVIPDKDPFYQPPAGFETSPPGTVFKNRGTNSGILGVSATQILYRTTDATGNASATVATILKGPKSSPNKLLAYSDYEDATNTTCSPSYLFTTNNPSTIFGPTFGNQVTGGLDKGWTLVIADYEGFKSAFAVGRLEGQAVLDALRAVKSYKPAGISANAVMGGYGYSGGAIATGWAAALHPTYAPELNIKGWAFGGTPANVTSTLLKVDGGLFAGFAVAGIAGHIQAYPEALERFNELATPFGKFGISLALKQCAIADIVLFVGESVLSTNVQSLGAGLLSDPVIASILAKGTLGSNSAETPTAPVYMYHGLQDEVIPYDSAKATANSWCASGGQVTFVTETAGTGHLGTDVALYAAALDWLDARITGVALPTGCSSSNVSSLGLPFKRDDGRSVIERFGVADSKVVARMTEQYNRGEKIDSLWSYA